MAKTNKLTKKQKIQYNSRTWLNSIESPSSGACAAYHGITYRKDIYGAFFEVSDCHCSARLHMTELDTPEDFIQKLRLLASEASKFADWLENNYK